MLACLRVLMRLPAWLAQYEGSFRDGVMQGPGTKLWPDGRRYDGQWVKGERSGRGTMTWPNGDKYQGALMVGGGGGGVWE